MNRFLEAFQEHGWLFAAGVNIGIGSGIGVGAAMPSLTYSLGSIVFGLFCMGMYVQSLKNNSPQ